MKTIKRFTADDGTEFDTRREALAHEERGRVAKVLADLLEEDFLAALDGRTEAVGDAILDAAKIVRAARKGREG